MNWTFFTDRDLGKQFPAILTEAGFSVERHLDHFAPKEKDEICLREAVMSNGARMFVAIEKTPYPNLARGVVNAKRRILAFLDRTPPPFIAKIYQPAPLALLRNAQASGQVELWLPEKG